MEKVKSVLVAAGGFVVGAVVMFSVMAPALRSVVSGVRRFGVVGVNSRAVYDQQVLLDQNQATQDLLDIDSTLSATRGIAKLMKFRGSQKTQRGASATLLRGDERVLGLPEMRIRPLDVGTEARRPE
ncbi:MAG: hypothetical protein ACP5I8_16235 [Phycisphaerae bacterium]